MNRNIEEVEANMKTLGINLVQVGDRGGGWVGEGLPTWGWILAGLKGLEGLKGAERAWWRSADVRSVQRQPRGPVGS